MVTRTTRSREISLPRRYIKQILRAYDRDGRKAASRMGSVRSAAASLDLPWATPGSARTEHFVSAGHARPARSSRAPTRGSLLCRSGGRGEHEPADHLGRKRTQRGRCLAGGTDPSTGRQGQGLGDRCLAASMAVQSPS
jgi:hypothetical protein